MSSSESESASTASTQSTVTPVKKGKKKTPLKRTDNPIWDYFTKFELNGVTYARCKLCPDRKYKIADATTSNMHRHLEVTHPQLAKELLEKKLAKSQVHADRIQDLIQTSEDIVKETGKLFIN